MPLPKHIQAHRSKIWKFFLSGASSFAIALVGCNNTCFVFTSNPPTGTVNIKVSDQKRPCMLNTANGAVQVLAQADFTCPSCSGATRIANNAMHNRCPRR
jgi:hypothetical protein